MRWLLAAVLMLLPLQAFASAEKKDKFGLTPSERNEMQLCISLNDYRQAVEEVANLSSDSSRKDVEYALESVDKEWKDVERDADDYEAVQTTQLARSADRLDAALENVSKNTAPETVQSKAGPAAEQTLEQLDEVQAKVDCSKPVDHY